MTKDNPAAARKKRRSSSTASLRVVRGPDDQTAPPDDLPVHQTDGEGASFVGAGGDAPIAGSGLAVEPGAEPGTAGEALSGDAEGTATGGESPAGDDAKASDGKDGKDGKKKRGGAKEQDPLAGHDTKPNQQFLGGGNAAKVGMAPNYPPEVIDAAYATLNARREYDRAAAKYQAAGEVLVQRMDRNKLRMVKVPNEHDLVFRLESPAARLKMDGYKKPKGEKPAREKKAKGVKATKAPRGKKTTTATAPKPKAARKAKATKKAASKKSARKK